MKVLIPDEGLVLSDDDGQMDYYYFYSETDMPYYWRIENYYTDKLANWSGFQGGIQIDIQTYTTIEPREMVSIGIVSDSLPEDATLYLTAIPSDDFAELYAPRTVKLSWTLS